MRVVSLGSGSSGNALLIEAGPKGRTKLLVDAGLPGKLLLERLRQVHIMPGQLQGILLTHEHSDHVIGLPHLLKRFAIPLIADTRTLQAVQQGLTTGTWATDAGSLSKPRFDADVAQDIPGEERVAFPLNLNANRQTPLAVGSCSTFGDIEVTSFAVSHDAAAPCGYLLNAGGCRVCVSIDSGEVTSTMLEAMSQADLLVLESNHDRERLLRGPYPYPLKQRILSATGHLSNDQAADAVLRTWRGDGVRWLWLAHLSKTNNTPVLALQHMRLRLEAARVNTSQVHITTLPPGIGGVWDSTQLWHNPSLWETQH